MSEPNILKRMSNLVRSSTSKPGSASKFSLETSMVCRDVSINDVSCSRDGLIALACSNGKVVCWRPNTPNPRFGFDHPNANCIDAAQITSDGKTIIAATNDYLYMWDVATRERRAKYNLQWTSSVSCIDISANGTHLAMGTWLWSRGGSMDNNEGQLFRIHLPTRKVRAYNMAMAITSVAASPVDFRVAMGSQEGDVVVMDTKSDEELWESHVHSFRVAAVCFTADGRQLLSAGMFDGVCVWDAVTGSVLRTIPYGIKGSFSVSKAAFSQDRDQLLIVHKRMSHVAR